MTKFLSIVAVAALFVVGASAQAETTSLTSLGLTDNVVSHQMTTNSMADIRGELLKTSRIEYLFNRIYTLNKRGKKAQARSLAAFTANKGEFSTIRVSKNKVYNYATQLCSDKKQCGELAESLNNMIVHDKLQRKHGKYGTPSINEIKRYNRLYLDTSYRP